MMSDIPKELVIYQAKNGEIKLKYDVNNETIWASKKDIAQIYGIDRSVVSRHINNLFKSEEVNQDEVCAFFAHTTKSGAHKEKTQTRQVEYYNLDIILAESNPNDKNRMVGLVLLMLKDA